MTKKCEYCQNMYPDNFSACPVCGSHKFIDLGKIEAEQKSIERKAKMKYSAKFVIVGIILWLVLYFTILFLSIQLLQSVSGTGGLDNLIRNLIVIFGAIASFFVTLYVGFRISYQLTFKKKKT